MCSNVETSSFYIYIFIYKLVMFPDFEFRTSLYFSVLLIFLLDFMPNYKRFP